MSRHRLRKYPNLSKGLEIDCSEQLWVSDITYLSVEGRHCYLILITDGYSRKVLGYNFGRNMDTSFCILALEKALANRCFSDRQLMHHSDRGLQYCSKAYVEILEKNEIVISMTENGDLLENALDEPFLNFEQAQKTIEKAIKYYNNRLPHLFLDMLTPNEAHHKTGKLKKHWK